MGIRQSSLYHHFSTKDDILEDLLEGTVAGGLEFARAVAGTPVKARDDGDRGREGPAGGGRLHAVALYDGTQLCSARWNLGVLYNLPEAGAPVPGVHGRPQELRGSTSGLARISRERLERHRPVGDLAFRLVESLVYLRAEGLHAESALQAADAGIILGGLGDSLLQSGARSGELIAANRS